MPILAQPNVIPRFTVKSLARDLAGNGTFLGGFNMIKTQIGGVDRGPFSHVTFFVHWAIGDTPVDGVILSLLGAAQEPDIASPVTDDQVAFYSDVSLISPRKLVHTSQVDTTISTLPTLPTDTIEVGSTSNAKVGTNILVDDLGSGAGGTAKQFYQYRVKAILSAPARLQFDRNLEDAHQATSIVHTMQVQEMIVPRDRAIVAVRPKVENLDTDAGDLSYLGIFACAVEGWQQVIRNS